MFDKSAVTAHFVTYWGVPSEIRPRDIHEFESFAILEFPPRGTRATWRYATNGMSTLQQFYSDPKIAVRTELYACTQNKALWVDELLAAMASYPWQHRTYFAQWDTVEVGQPVDRRNSPYTGILLVPPGSMDPPTLGLVGGVPESVLVHQLLGLLPAELQYAKTNNGRVLWERIIRACEPMLDESRTPIM